MTILSRHGTPHGVSVIFSSPRSSAPVSWPPAAREAAFWAAHLGFWGLVYAALLVVCAVYRPGLHIPPEVLAARVAACLAATATMRWLSLQPRVLERLNVTRAGLVAGGLLSAAVAITLLFPIVAILFGGDSEQLSRGRLVADLAITITLLASWCALYFGFQLIRERTSAEFRAMEAESLALRNELHRLQAQISPHFLFNALNTVLACRDDPDAIETVTQSLSRYLRFLLRPAAALEPLSRELDALEQYLTVQTMRFGAGLVTRIDCDVDVRGVPVPPVLVQPLVENALKYGAESGVRPLRIEVSARRDGPWLAIDVANTGRWVPPGRRESTGTGLDSLERRLRMLVGAEATVSHAEEDGWVRVRVRIPLDAAAAESDDS
jgi:signal transduction histidine kinase